MLLRPQIVTYNIQFFIPVLCTSHYLWIVLESFREVTKRSFKLLREVLKKGGYPQFGGLEGQEGGNPSDQDFVKG